MAHDVFVSHSVKDKAVADAVVARLEAKSVTCWVAPRDVVPGADWGESIINAIESSRIMILIFSKSANQSSQIKREVERAVNKEVYIIPFRIDDIPPTRSLEYFISTSQWLDAFSPPLERHLDNLAKTVKAVLANPSLRKSVEIEAPLNTDVSAAHPSIEAHPTRHQRHGLPSRWWMAILATVPVVIVLAAAGWYLDHKREAPPEKLSRAPPAEKQVPVAMHEQAAKHLRSDAFSSSTIQKPLVRGILAHLAFIDHYTCVGGMMPPEMGSGEL
jgi:hypothetical protein